MKKTVSLMMAAVMTASLAACGGSSSSSTTTSGAATTETTAASATTAADTATKTTDTDNKSAEGEPEERQFVQDSYKVASDLNLTIASSASSTNAGYQMQVDAAKAVNEASGGKINIQTVWDGTLGSDSELIENCIAGSIPMISLASSPLLNYVPQVAVFDMPAVYTSRQEAFEGISQFEDAMGSIMEQSGLKLLGLGFSQFRGLSSNRELKTPDDFKGLKIRTMENSYHMAFWQNMGAAPTPLAFSELYLSLQQGLVEAQDNPLATLESSKFAEVQKYFMPVTVFPLVNMRLMNLDQFNALEPEAQQALIDFAHQDNYDEYRIQFSDDEKVTTEMQGKVTFLEQTPEIYDAMQEAAKPVWDQVRSAIGDDLADAYLKAAGQM
ncbi:TRAP transporter substrate-binding protein [Clostridium vitabionis]|uniref:TRAP transporter substrate-binding protein n=1 Tax=Clostridium vitabionis TaxID=2784388 RepID=UPI00188D3D35|nr:TRAP transporter substrate-binding protein [Clostridium vitabionis]